MNKILKIAAKTSKNSKKNTKKKQTNSQKTLKIPQNQIKKPLTPCIANFTQSPKKCSQNCCKTLKKHQKTR
jgi:hypothetical protein